MTRHGVAKIASVLRARGVKLGRFGRRFGRIVRLGTEGVAGFAAGLLGCVDADAASFYLVLKLALDDLDAADREELIAEVLRAWPGVPADCFDVGECVSPHLGPQHRPELLRLIESHLDPQFGEDAAPWVYALGRIGSKTDLKLLEEIREQGGDLKHAALTAMRDLGKRA